MTEPTQGRDVAEFIREQHQEITRLFSAVEAGQGDGRQDAFECLVRLLAEGSRNVPQEPITPTQPLLARCDQGILVRASITRGPGPRGTAIR
jgi:hypothetical protein